MNDITAFLIPFLLCAPPFSVLKAGPAFGGWEGAYWGMSRGGGGEGARPESRMGENVCCAVSLPPDPSSHFIGSLPQFYAFELGAYSHNMSAFSS